jgi:tetratricopeptide (TPR) repeat protein
MFSFFKKDYRHYLTKGEKYLQEERYADAKFAFATALEKIDASSGDGKGDEALLRTKLSHINNSLADLNLKEAQYALNSGNQGKANEHLQIVMELAEDGALREKAEKLAASISSENDFHNLNNNNNGCSSCKTSHLHVPETAESGFDADSHLSPEEKFELLISTLPAPLPERYASLGKDFAYCYLYIHDGKDDKALPILEQLLRISENDILYYELSLIKYRQNDSASCEENLKRAIAINPQNPLCYLALVQLRIDGGHYAETIPLLQHMIASNLLSNQARIILGDVYLSLSEEAKATDVFSEALSLPGIAREAAERLLPLLVKEGRLNEAEYLKKQYLKKCC